MQTRYHTLLGLFCLIAASSSNVRAQSRGQFGAGFGLGPTSVSGSAAEVVFADTKWVVATPLKLGAEVWFASNHHRICLVGAGSTSCPLLFPDVVGVAPTISWGLWDDRLEVGAGPGLFKQYYSKDVNAVVGGVIAHASAAIIRNRYVDVQLSARPLLGPSSNGRATWVVPIVLGLSR